MPAHNNTPNLSTAGRTGQHVAPAEGQFTHLSVVDLVRTYPDRRVLTNISFTAAPGDRIGLIGENGTGKSTLLRVLAGIDEPDSGTISMPGTVELLHQELPYPDDATVALVLDDAQRESLGVLGDLERLGVDLAELPDDAAVANAYADALAEADRVDAWAAESRRGDVVSGLGLGGIQESRPIGELSGGQRLRLALAAVILRAPQVLLLDEPSNHLDDASAAYLERVLASWPGIVIVASHDRALLDAVTTRILDLDPLPVAAQELADASVNDSPEAGEVDTATSTDDPGSGFGIRVWGVGYTAARRERQAEMRRWRDQYAQEHEAILALEHEIAVGSREVNRKHEAKSEARITKKFYADKDARVTARRARNASVRLENLERDRVRRPPEPLRFHGFAQVDREDAQGTSAPTEPTENGPILSAHRVSVADRLREVSVDLEPHDRLLLTGPNGSGKSTLLALLAGTLEPDSGAVEQQSRIGYLPQEVVFARPDRSAAATYRDAVGPEISERLPLSTIGLIAERDVDRPVGLLSVGQRRRLALATLVADPPPVLLLDEPTNHLSLTLVEELEEALRAYDGALIVASHDRWLRSQWAGRVMQVS